MESDILKIRSFLKEIKKSPEEPHSSNSKRPFENYEPETELTELERCLRKNIDCNSIISATFSHLQSLLDDCTREIKLVRENIIAVQNGKALLRKYQKIHLVCNSPYFKDADGFPAPPNRDVVFREANGFIDLCNLRKSDPWTPEQKYILERSIRATEIDRWTKIAKKAGTEQFCNFEQKTLAQLIGTRKDEYDWMKISVADLKNARTPFECRSVWFNYLHPAINKEKWSKEEDTRLVEIVEKYNRRDWAKIAEELNTNRSPYQCIGHYSFRLRPIGSRPWTQDEDELLRKCVNNYCFGMQRPWGKIAWHFDGRTRTEIVRHWGCIKSDAKKGKYSLEEDIIIAAGLKYFGTDYAKIADFLPNRNNIQVRARVQVLQSHQSGVSPWTPPEDQLLCQLVKKYGYGKWAKISTHFINRSNGSCRTRYQSILTWKEKHGPDSMPVVNKSIANYGGTLNDLWKRAERIMREKGFVSSNGSLSNVKMVDDLSAALFYRRKPGRPVGGKAPEEIDKEYYKMFSSCYSQKGGRGKNVVSKELLPYMIKDTIITLNLMNAKLNLPQDMETIENDFRLPVVDKIFLKFLISNEDLAQSIYVSMDRLRETNREIIYLCPPNYTTLVGLRTMLLKRQSLKDQAKGDTLVPYTKPSGESSTGENRKSDEFKAACRQWNNRLQFLFTWAAHASKQYPNKDCPLAPETPLNFQSYGCKEVPKSETKKKIKPKAKKFNKPPEQRRAYNKTGKYKVSGDPGGAIRKSSRLSHGSEADTGK